MDGKKEELILKWYEQYYADIYRFILYMIGDMDCCEDLIHDTFVRAFSAYERFEQRSSVKTWLFSIARNLVIDEIRRRKRRRLFMRFTQHHELSSSFSLEQEFVNKESILELMTQIGQLKPIYREVVILKKIEECSTKEIAEILDCSETKVRKTLSRALQELRTMYRLEGGEGIEQTIG
ncbi:RNA polymerase sigma factor [Robertmurraya yapensis]|uniref:RNA polymerase sigma factor n=2 Tax=Bacillaceae TaxID=186817 RepID=A0A3S0I5G6_9BACI|nr:RNA polymerase sigma factor [Bacillus yapensis]RTR27880.1 RNA polymerase sigma factor [Bacillus yapensis]TKS94283.1 sigma-70 family RNA polymerase sigma factor [Bacillus yapensis]